MYKATNKKNCINDRLPQGKALTSALNFFINLVEKITNDIHNFEKKEIINEYAKYYKSIYKWFSYPFTSINFEKNEKNK